MPNFKELITFEYENEYKSAYDLSVKRNFSIPKIYSANGDLNKRWYVYFSFRDPKSGKLKRQTPFYGNANTYKSKEDRLSVLVTYRKVLLRLLKQGYDPYSDNVELHQSLHSKNRTTVVPESYEKDNGSSEPIAEKRKMTVQEGFEFAIKLKEKVISQTTKKDYESKIKNLLEWLKTYRSDITYITELDKKVVTSFLNHVLDKNSARTRNNYKSDLSSIIQVLVDNEIIEQNFIKKIPKLKSIPQRNKTYSQHTQEEIFDYLKTNDPILLLYIKFISYNFLRPIEVCRLKVKDIDLKNKRIQFKAKNSPLKTKIIPELLWADLPDLGNLDKDAILFTPDKIGGTWDTAIQNRRDYFSKRFKRVVKDHFNLGMDYGLYSFRHTYITKVYRALIKDSSPFEAKSKLMLITGHTSMTALEKYLRDIDAQLPEDYSTMLTNVHG
ncbi:Phage integrase, N-terminal SAM-like domain [Maribacter sedimenticola]|uniref:Phage integrase, N-terminal SAM-like domain n=1 Tax=Maribacter sedimenticola TaxID=228956 RepID=A0ABY1SH87_9FLAO|nr:site-specific integrase [Maribacter sedimenticola]SNR48778.1 Phage integrase, N-terminal SAM-like domain [Maribacter sedimenticola]